jgi:FMN phosphatase YigB (HAD superfamily)
MKQKGRIPEFKSREEEAHWWETHNLADNQDEFETVDAQFAKNLSHGLTIRLDRQTLAKVRTLARKKGIGVIE